MKTAVDKPVILIVDDKPANILSLESLLANGERKFLSATNGKDALTILLNKRVDLLILDVQMPGMDGFEVAQILKSNKRTKDIPIIFASAEKKELQSMMRGYEEGAIDYLFKPLQPEIVKAKVDVLLKVQLQKRELLEKNLSLERTALLINNSADIIGIIEASTLKIVEVNSAFTSILGFTKEETKDTSITFFLNDKDREFVQRLAKQAKEHLSFETKVYCKDRSTKWLHWNVVVKAGMWFLNARDITKIKEVERIRNYLAMVVKQSSDAIYITDPEGKIISWNEGAEKMYGYTESEALKMGIRNIIPDYIHEKTNDIVNQVLGGTRIEEKETIRITKRGKLIDVLFSASVINDLIIGQSCMAITERDITQKKIADEQIRQLNMNLERKVAERTAELSEKEAMLRETYEKLLTSEKQIRFFARNLNQAIEDERAHIAREIHDEIGQQLVGIKIELSAICKMPDISAEIAETAQKVIREADHLMQSLRKIATQLRPGILDSLGLIPSIEWLVKEFRKKTGVACEAELNGMDHTFDKNVSICFFRICQEALTNIAKHANATKVIVETYVNNKELLLIISDNGKGIASDKLENPFSMGLLGMRERANLIGADLSLTSRKNQGTTIQLKVNLKEDEKNTDSRRSSSHS